MAVEIDNFDFDPEYLRKKYREERDKRLRQDGNEQYQEVSGEFSYFVEDPYVEEELSRDAIKEDAEVVIIGGGFGGMLAGARLREAGIDDFRIIEKGGDFGGTWYWNRYPGASCDIESYIYFPLLEETGFVPKQKYTNAPETLEYCKVICEKFNLYENAYLQTEVTSTDWDEDSLRWTVKTNQGDEIKARYVVHSNGPLNRPKLPAIKGINDFKGHTFHTSRWDYEYTGGNSHGNLSNLKDKKVRVAGLKPNRYDSLKGNRIGLSIFYTSKRYNKYVKNLMTCCRKRYRIIFIFKSKITIKLKNSISASSCMN